MHIFEVISNIDFGFTFLLKYYLPPREMTKYQPLSPNITNISKELGRYIRIRKINGLTIFGAKCKPIYHTVAPYQSRLVAATKVSDMLYASIDSHI